MTVSQEVESAVQSLSLSGCLGGGYPTGGGSIVGIAQLGEQSVTERYRALHRSGRGFANPSSCLSV